MDCFLIFASSLINKYKPLVRTITFFFLLNLVSIALLIIKLLSIMAFSSPVKGLPNTPQIMAGSIIRIKGTTLEKMENTYDALTQEKRT